MFDPSLLFKFTPFSFEAVKSILTNLMMSNEAPQIAFSKCTPEDLGMLGVSIHYLSNHFLAEVRNASLDETANIYEIEEAVIKRKGAQILCPVDKKLGTAYVHSLENTNNVGNATVMISYAWSYTIGDIVDTLIEYCTANKLNPRKTYVWICCLCINQHRVAEQRSRGEVVKFEKFRSVFEERVTKIGNIIAMIINMREPTYLRRAWCVFELYAANKIDCKVTLGMPSRERKSFIDGMKSDDGNDQLNQLFEMLSNTDVRKAKATVESDRTQILSLIKNGPGYEKFNTRVCDLVKKWAIGVVLSQFENATCSRTNTAHKMQQGIFLNNAGELFNRIADYDQALAMAKDALLIFESMYGRKNKHTSKSLEIIDSALFFMGENDNAMEIHKEVLSIRVKVFGREHEKTTASLSWIARILDNQDEEKEKSCRFLLDSILTHFMLVLVFMLRKCK